MLTGILWAFLALLAAAVGIGSIERVFLSPGFPFGFRPEYSQHLTVVLTHATAAVTAIFIGPVQFVDPVRRRWPAVHRTAGMTYLCCVAVAAATGGYMALWISGGPAAQGGVILVSVLWVATGVAALRAAVKGDFRQHRRWMLHNFGLTLSTIAFRLYPELLMDAGTAPAQAYLVAAWASWLPNLAVAEIWWRAVPWPARGR